MRSQAIIDFIEDPSICRVPFGPDKCTVASAMTMNGQRASGV